MEGFCVDEVLLHNFQLGGPEKLIGADNPRHAPQENRGLADIWHLDDGDILRHPMLVLPNLQAFDITNAKTGAERIGKSTTFAQWPLFPRQLMETSLSGLPWSHVFHRAPGKSKRHRGHA